LFIGHDFFTYFTEDYFHTKFEVFSINLSSANVHISNLYDIHNKKDFENDKKWSFYKLQGTKNTKDTKDHLVEGSVFDYIMKNQNQKQKNFDANNLSKSLLNYI